MRTKMGDCSSQKWPSKFVCLHIMLEDFLSKNIYSRLYLWSRFISGECSRRSLLIYCSHNYCYVWAPAWVIIINIQQNLLPLEESVSTTLLLIPFSFAVKVGNIIKLLERIHRSFLICFCFATIVVYLLRYLWAEKQVNFSNKYSAFKHTTKRGFLNWFSTLFWRKTVDSNQLWVKFQSYKSYHSGENQGKH